MEIYQWLFSTSGFDTSNIGYFLYVNGQKSNGFYFEDCEGRMIFDTTMIAYEGTSDWVEKSIVDAKDCLHSEALPQSADDCDNCRYFLQRADIENEFTE